MMENLINNIGNYFFKGNWYISRIDIAAVVMVEDIQTELKFYREFKQRTARIGKYNHQNYKDSVFYFSKEYAMKIYDKYKESKNILHKNLLRYEMTIRSSMLEKILKTSKKPYYGIRSVDMDYKKIVDYFFDRFQNYAVKRKVKEVRGKITPLQKAMITIKENNPELFRQMVSEKSVSRQTITRMTNHTFNIGETVPLQIALTNNGQIDSGNLTVRLKSKSIYLSVIDSVSTINTINPGLERNNSSNPFIVHSYMGIVPGLLS